MTLCTLTPISGFPSSATVVGILTAEESQQHPNPASIVRGHTWHMRRTCVHRACPKSCWHPGPSRGVKAPPRCCQNIHFYVCRIWILFFVSCCSRSGHECCPFVLILTRKNRDIQWDNRIQIISWTREKYPLGYHLHNAFMKYKGQFIWKAMNATRIQTENPW
jgi:hypothetical protein